MRVKCAGRGCEHARSSHDADGTCLVCPTLPPDPTGRKGSCRGWAEKRPHAWRDYVTETYWHDRAQWRDVLFESECNMTYRPGIIARERRRERRGGRREVTDFLERHPAPTLRRVLEQAAGMWRDPEAA